MLFGLLAPMCAGLFFIARPLVELMVAPSYQAATIAVLPAAALAGAARNWRVHFVDHAYLLVARTGVLTAVCAAEALFVLAGCVVGYAQGGVGGAAWGAFAGVMGSVVVGLVVATGKFSLTIPLADMARVAFATSAMCGVLALAPFVQWPALARIGADVALGGCVYALALLLVHPALRRVVGRVAAQRRSASAALAAR
jgi:O-antigen/teichoic acid export membrane protein